MFRFLGVRFGCCSLACVFSCGCAVGVDLLLLLCGWEFGLVLGLAVVCMLFLRVFVECRVFVRFGWADGLVAAATCF